VKVIFGAKLLHVHLSHVATIYTKALPIHFPRTFASENEIFTRGQAFVLRVLLWP